MAEYGETMKRVLRFHPDGGSMIFGKKDHKFEYLINSEDIRRCIVISLKKNKEFNRMSTIKCMAKKRNITEFPEENKKRNFFFRQFYEGIFDYEDDVEVFLFGSLTGLSIISEDGIIYKGPWSDAAPHWEVKSPTLISVVPEIYSTPLATLDSVKIEIKDGQIIRSVPMATSLMDSIVIDEGMALKFKSSESKVCFIYEDKKLLMHKLPTESW